MSSTGPWWLTVSVAFAGPIAGLAVGHRLTSRRDRVQAWRADHERDRAERRRGYLGLFEAADTLDAAIADGRGEQALEQVRRASSIALFDAGPGIERHLREVVEAARRWVQVVAAHAPSSTARAEAAAAFRERLSTAHALMRADIAADQEAPASRPSLLSRFRGTPSS